jgi:hypothetical protein
MEYHHDDTVWDRAAEQWNDHHRSEPATILNRRPF